ncbi:MAG: MBL fold metallo-hydrolase [Thermoproteota archaeon]
MGVRSMCCLVETNDTSILFDAGVSLGLRFNLVPHPREYMALAEARRKIRELAQKVDIITISHYHFDHFTPPFLSDTVWTWASKEEAIAIYGGKRVLVKDIRDNINYSQRKRGWIFRNIVGPMASSVEEADGKTVKVGDTELRFSPPLSHGEEGSELGYVIVITIKCKGESVTIAPDLQGPLSDEALSYLELCKSDIVIIGGPPTYLAQSKLQEDEIEKGFRNMSKLASVTKLTIVDHHLLRDAEWRRKASAIFSAAKANSTTVQTAAEFLGLSDNLLEAYRKKLYDEEPPSDEFMAWTRLPIEKRRKIKPPL